MEMKSDVLVMPRQLQFCFHLVVKQLALADRANHRVHGGKKVTQPPQGGAVEQSKTL